MSRTARLPRRYLAPLVAVVAAALALTGCAAGQVSQTANEVAAVDGANGTSGSLGLRNVVLETPTDVVKGYSKGADARVLMFVSNDGTSADTLTGASTPAAASISITGSATVPAQTLGDFTGGAVNVTLKGLTSALTFGTSVPVTFTFARAGNITLSVPIEIPGTRTTGRPNINIQPTESGSLWHPAEPSR